VVVVIFLKVSVEVSPIKINLINKR